jgi:protein-S-isoprenylcysteine O-methyltransferase Ste14
VRTLEHRIPPPLVVVALSIGMYWLSAHIAHVNWSFPIRVGLVLCFAGLGVSFLGAGFFAFSLARTTIDPVHPESASALVTTGVFRITRNPMYVGFAAILTAWAIWLQTPWALGGVALFIAFTWRFQIVPEERALAKKFGGSYEHYKQSVRRWL